MSLFQRFFAIAVLVLVFQGFLTGLLVTKRVREQDKEYAITELDESSQLIYENFNNWKRALWQQLVTIPENETPEVLARQLSARGTVDWVVESDTQSEFHQAYPVTGIPYPEDIEASLQEASGPKISMDYLGETVLLRASRTLTRDNGRAIGVHLVKLVDESFCHQLAIDSPGIATFLTAAGSLPQLPELPAARFFQKASESQRGYLRLLGERNRSGELYNGSLRNAGLIFFDSGPRSLYLAVVLDGSWQEQRLQSISRSLMVASLISIGLSAALVLFGSWTLSKPVIRLGEAMEQVAGGDFSVRLNGAKGQETRTLFTGFNRMTSQLEQDVRERERHIGEITALTNTNETIFQSIGTGMITVDRDFHILRVNSTGAQLLGRKEEQLSGTNLKDLNARELGPHLLDVAAEVLSGNSSCSSRLRRTSDKVYQLSGFLLRALEGLDGPILQGCLLIVEDATEKISLEERMVRAEKLSSLAILTAGVAHEINNPLSSITTNVQNIACEIEDPEHKRAIDYIQQETRRIRDIVARLLEFAGKNSVQRQWADLNEEVKLVLANVRYSFPRGVASSVETRLEERLPPTSVPGDELRQMILNLITNAFQAVDDTKGTVMVTTGRNGDWLHLEVKDDGMGIAEEQQGRIFDPFFTTKPDGSGLGLSVVYGLVNRRDGSCTIRSAKGKGTTVRLTLPIRRDTPNE